MRRYAIALAVLVLGTTGCANRFACDTGAGWLNEGEYRYFTDNTLKECDNPAGNGFAAGIGMIAPDRLSTIRDCGNEPAQQCVDDQARLYATTAAAYAQAQAASAQAQAVRQGAYNGAYQGALTGSLLSAPQQQPKSQFICQPAVVGQPNNPSGYICQ